MFLINTLPEHGAPLVAADAARFGADATAPVRAFLAACGEPRPTPLQSLPGLASEAGVAEVWIKDEAGRLGLGSFKALGGAYAVAALTVAAASARLGRSIGFDEMASPAVRALAQTLTFACATDGNHGRAVAAGARRVGARAVVLMHRGVSAPRAQAIADFGAEVVRVPGTYDDAVAEAARRGAENGWILVADTAPDPDSSSPGLVMQGYTALADEALAQLDRAPTHVFVQAGVGGLAGAVAAHLAMRLGAGGRSKVVVVEPERAACVLESVRAGRPVRLAEGPATVMAMLECREPSGLAWRLLSRAADAFMALPDEDAVAAMKRLARPLPGDPGIVAGESGGVGVAGLLRAAADPEIRHALRLGPDARVLAINSEGATDPARYRLLVGREPAANYD